MNAEHNKNKSAGTTGREDQVSHTGTTPATSLTESEKKYEQGTDQDVFAVKDSESAIQAKHTGKDVANNDGSVLETLDTAFHGEPGYNASSSDSGSNRADFYEERSFGATEDEEELNADDQQQKD